LTPPQKADQLWSTGRVWRDLTVLVCPPAVENTWYREAVSCGLIIDTVSRGLLAVAAFAEDVARLDGRDLDATASMPHGDVPIRTLLEVFSMEASIHGSDVAEAFVADEPSNPPVL
jgi:hypothetical protein